MHGRYNDHYGDRAKLYNDVFPKIYQAIFGSMPRIPTNYAQSRLLWHRLREMLEKISGGDFDWLCVL